MRSLTANLRIENALNKLSTGANQNIASWKKQEAVNKAVLDLCRRQIHGANQFREGKEASVVRVDDLQVLLKVQKLSGSDKGLFFLSSKLPTDYFGYSRVTPICSKDTCTNIRIPSILIEDSNVDVYLTDGEKQPSFDFEQSFHTLAGGRVRMYHNKDFIVNELELSYYKLPQYIEFPNTPLPTGGVGKDMEWEFKEDFCHLIIEEAISILAANIQDANTLQVASQKVEQNN